MLMKSLTQVGGNAVSDGAGWFWTDPPEAPPRCGPPSCATACKPHSRGHQPHPRNSLLHRVSL